MIEGLLGGGALDAVVLDRVVAASEGNPLFAEQLLGMLVDEHLLSLEEGTWRFTEEFSEINVPPTIQALLASRLDTLESSERSVIEPASVVGYVFPEEAVTALAPPEVAPRVGSELATLTHKHLVRPVEDGADGAHRFHHIMIRDTAYDGILKRARADLHTRFVAWADLANRDRMVEFEEILGYHLEQAWTYLSELGPLDERGREIGEEGARRLASAGRRAFGRGDIPGAASLLGRAAALLPRRASGPARCVARLRRGAPPDRAASTTRSRCWTRPHGTPGSHRFPRPGRRSPGCSSVFARAVPASGGANASRRRSRRRCGSSSAPGTRRAWRRPTGCSRWSAGTACRFGDCR